MSPYSQVHVGRVDPDHLFRLDVFEPEDPVNEERVVIYEIEPVSDRRAEVPRRRGPLEIQLRLDGAVRGADVPNMKAFRCDASGQSGRRLPRPRVVVLVGDFPVALKLGPAGLG